MHGGGAALPPRALVCRIQFSPVPPKIASRNTDLRKRAAGHFRVAKLIARSRAKDALAIFK